MNEYYRELFAVLFTPHQDKDEVSGEHAGDMIKRIARWSMVFEQTISPEIEKLIEKHPQASVFPGARQQLIGEECVFFLLAAMTYANNKADMEYASANIAHAMTKHYTAFEVLFKSMGMMVEGLKEMAEQQGMDVLDMCSDPGVKIPEIELEVERKLEH